MPTWLKVVLAVVVIGVLGVAAVGYAGYWWFTKNKDRFAEIGKRAKADAEQFAASHTSAQCVDEALERLDRGGGIMGEAEVGVFLEACLDRARPTGTLTDASLCDPVPSRDDILKSAAWAVMRCAELGRGGSQPCGRVLQAVQRHCENRASFAPPPVKEFAPPGRE